MTKLYLIILWIVTVLMGSVVLPALGFAENYLVLVLMLASLIFWGFEPWLILWTVFLTLIFEIITGFHLGSVALPFLFCALIFYIAGLFLTIQPFAAAESSTSFFAMAIVGIVLEIIYSFLFFVELRFYGEPVFAGLQRGEPAAIQSVFHSPAVYLYLAAVFVIYFLLFKMSKVNK